jgi:hypothetical protein
MRSVLAEAKHHRSKEISFKGGLAQLICLLVGLAAVALLLYTLF